MKDKKAIGLISSCVKRLKYGHFGDFKSIGNDIYELRLCKFFGMSKGFFLGVQADLEHMNIQA